MKVKTLPAAVLLSFAFAACGGGEAETRIDDSDPNAPILRDFQARVDRYLDVRKEAARAAPRLKETDDPAKIVEAQEKLTANIRTARADARPGDIFSPEIRQLFRRLMYPEMKGQDAAATKEVIRQDAPAPASVPIEVNARYPDDQPLPTVPANLLAALPSLPEELEYRIVRRDLILRDVDANLIVDYIPNAIR
jgi:hypothetical protein